ncbi:TRAM domain-containing protein [Haloarcula onubensis]|uniref:TRAM domain-containing protein n=1 Tax=Haloarcula onubensis TaxID=2950539 RepID=A0ABU2FUY9_9EURY|nr:TRAM domain-containing protein [Halomicroarcula sp. S3CR25-11]MDS0284581.1 TRAM domain-containing protein [Halomicroarcula sp. S3CR25-11]
MPQISDSLRLLFETSVRDEGDRYTVAIPSELVENGSIDTTESYRVALLAAADEPSEPTESDTDRSVSRPEPAPSHTQGPPVEEGEVRTVSIDTLGDQGDGIAKVERGFIVIVPGTKPGDRVEVEITDVKETVAFAETVGEATVR